MSEIIDEKEKLLIEFFLADKDLFIKVVRILNSEYFESPLDREIESLSTAESMVVTGGVVSTTFTVLLT